MNINSSIPSQQLSTNMTLRKRGEYVLAIASLLLYLVGVFVAFMHPVSGPEISIYNNSPVIYWASSFLSLALCISIFLYSHSRIVKLIGGCGLILNTVTFFSLYIIRNYLSYYVGSDAGSHLGTIYNILQTGFLEGNHYPIRHLLSATFTEITNLNYIHASNLISTALILVYILGIVLLVNKFIRSKQIRLFCYVATLIGPLSFSECSVVLMPYITGVLLFPIVIYLILDTTSEKSVSFQKLILISILLYIIPMIHELIGLLCVLFIACNLITISIVPAFIKRLGAWNVKLNFIQNIPIEPSSTKQVICLIILASISLMSWISHYVLGLLVNTIESHFVSAGEITVELSANLGYLDVLLSMDYLDIIRMVFTTYGWYAITILIGIINIPYLIRTAIKNKVFEEFLALLLFMCVCILGMLYLLINPSYMSSSRLSGILIIIPLISIGISVYRVVAYLSKQNVSKIIVGIISVSLLASSIFGLHLFFYPSYEYNNIYPFYTTEAELSGALFYLTNSNLNHESYSTYYEGTSLFRYLFGVTGTHYIKNVDGYEYDVLDLKNKVLPKDGNYFSIPVHSYITYYLPTILFHELSVYYNHIADNMKITSEDMNVTNRYANKIYISPTTLVFQKY